MTFLGVMLAAMRRNPRVETLSKSLQKITRLLFNTSSLRARSQDPTVRKISARLSNSSSLWGHHTLVVRDACTCSMCVDPFSGQKKFRTTDIPPNIKAKTISVSKGGLEIEWSHDIPGFKSHKSFVPFDNLPSIAQENTHPKESQKPITWDSNILMREMPTIRFDYNEYLNENNTLIQVINSISKWGIAFITEVPESEHAIEKIAHRIGPIRKTFYGETWDVRSVFEAKNIAYTDKQLGLHQDLLYMENPPGIQILHCLKNTCKGGGSLFCDGFRVATQLSAYDYDNLITGRILYHYQKAGEYYQCSHSLLEASPVNQTDTSGIRIPSAVYYAPPFQAPFSKLPRDTTIRTKISGFIRSLAKFAEQSELPQNVLKYRLRHGECVFLNNRRILHGREAFEAQSGERWLKGCYIDTDVFLSRSKTVLKDSAVKEEPLNPIRRILSS